MKQALSIIILSMLFFQCNDFSSSYSQRISRNDVGLAEPQPGEWLYEHSENGQTFRQYKNSYPVKPTEKRKIICIKPIGKFDKLQTTQIELIREYLEIYFQLKTITLTTVGDNDIPDTDRRIGYDKAEQLHAPYILDHILKNNIPDSAIVLMGISEKELYPKPDWNFVFGLAYLKQRVGISSLYRMQDAKPLTEENFALSLSRILKISSHEIGHMFSIKHCIYAACVMNGANHMQETDHSPMRACSVCQQKLQNSIGYDAEKRLKELINFLEKNKLNKEAQLLKADLP